MHWLQTLDADLFRLINQSLSNPVFDKIMPVLSGRGVSWLIPLLAVISALVLWRGNARARICCLMILAAIAVSDGVACNTIKHAINRDRPFITMPDVHLLVGRGHSASMPSSHAANSFAAMVVAYLFYRRSWRFMLPLALGISFSRIYNGVHYPSDVLAGAIIGAGCGAATVLGLNYAWQWAGRKWVPLWWERLPSLQNPEFRIRNSEFSKSAIGNRQSAIDHHWLRAGYVLLGFLLLARWIYLASGTIELSEDEAYQWLWSKHLALSYFSKPPLIAYTQFLGTTLWGDRQFGVRFFSPLISAVLGFVLLRFFAKQVNARAAFFLALIVTATPLLAVGSILMTVDPLSVLFWTLAMVAGWRAIQEKGTTRDWCRVGLWMGLGFLSKYTELFQLLCWVVFFALWPPARKHLARPGPYLALLINFLCSLPVLIWNQQHDWITVSHVANNAAVGAVWKPTLRYLGEFLGSELGLLNPIFFIAAIWAAIAFWRRHRQDPRFVYFFSMGAPLFLVYLLFTLHSRVLPNWIAPSVLPLFCLMVAYWDERRSSGAAHIGTWMHAGLAFGFATVIFLHNTDLAEKLAGNHLPLKFDPLRRVRGWKTTAEIVGQARRELLAEGKPVYIIGNHYGITSEITFYLPEARQAVRGEPLVYFHSNPKPVNQFFFWPGYEHRKDDSAILVRELDPNDDPKNPPRPQVSRAFDSVTEIGIYEIQYRKRTMRRIQLFACRGLH